MQTDIAPQSMDRPAVVRSYPGPWIAGTSLVLGPLLMLAGTLIRADSHFFFPEQLEAFVDHPLRMRVAYSLFLAGNIILFPGIIRLAQQVHALRPLWGLWGGTLVILGLLARSYHYGVNNALFVAADTLGVDQAVQLAGDFYGTKEWVVTSLVGAILFGWVILAVGALLSRTMPWWRCVGLLAMAALMIGVLKGTNVVSIVATSGLAWALVPHGISALREAVLPRRRSLITTVVALVVAVPLLVVFGQLG